MCDEVIAGPKTEAEVDAYCAAYKEAVGNEAGVSWTHQSDEVKARIAAVETKYAQVFCEAEGMVLRGDLLLCPEHATGYAWNVGRVEGEVKCHCGFFKPRGADCSEPCM